VLAARGRPGVEKGVMFAVVTGSFVHLVDEKIRKFYKTWYGIEHDFAEGVDVHFLEKWIRSTMDSNNDKK